MKAVGFDGGGVDLVAFRRIGMEGGELLRKIAQQLFFVDVRIWAAWERFIGTPRICVFRLLDVTIRLNR